MDLIKTEDFTKYVNDILAEWHTPGVAIAILQDDQIESRGYGNASIDPEVPVTPDTLFDIASSSKSITAASVALLVEDNERYPQVQWDSKMCDLLPGDFVMSDEAYTRAVTVEDILSHRSGLPSHDSSYVSSRADIPDTIQSVTRNLRNLQIAAPIRTKYMYCNQMYTVATYLVEKLTGMSFTDFVHQNLFKPMGMSSTHIQPENAIKAGFKDRMAIQYMWVDENYQPTPWEQAPESQGAGSIFTSVNDYIKYVRCMVNREGPISEDLYKGVTRPRIITEPDDNIDDMDPFTSIILYAAGWEVRWYRGHRIVQHDGLINGVGSVHFFMPDLKFGGVLLGNSDDGGIVGDILSKTLIDDFLGVPKADRVDWSAVVHKRTSEWKDKQIKGDALKKKIWPEFDGTCQKQQIPLLSYTGKYWNAGYHGMTVEIKHDKLYIDMSDRSMPFSLTFEHVNNQTEYVVYLNQWWVPDPKNAEELEGAFRFENDRVVKVGVRFEEDLDEMIWFDRVKES